MKSAINRELQRNGNMEIKELKENKKQFLPLLLLADEQEDMIEKVS